MTSRTARVLVAAVAIAGAATAAGCGESAESTGGASRCDPENLVWVYDRITDPESHGYPTSVFRFHDGEETELAGDDAAAPALSPDGGTVVFERGSGGDPESSGYARTRLYVTDGDGDGGEEPLLPEDPGPDGASVDWDKHPVWSPDGSRIAFVRNRTFPAGTGTGTGAPVHQVMVASVGDRAAQPLPGGVADLYDPAPAWSADGTRLAWVTGRTTLYWSSLDGHDRRQVGLTAEPIGPPAWIDGDRAIAVRVGDRMVRVDAASGATSELDLGVTLRALWTMPTGQLAGLDGTEARSRLVVVDPDEPGDVREITTVEGSSILPEGSVGARARGPVTAAPAASGGWESCPGRG